MLTEEDVWVAAWGWIEAASKHPMVESPCAYTMVLETDGFVAVTLRLWQWAECDHGDETQWFLRSVDEPGTTARDPGHLGAALCRAYHSHDQRWGQDSLGWGYASAVREALKRQVFQTRDPPAHPYVVPRCHARVGPVG